MLTNYLTWIMTFTDLTSSGVPRESIATFFIHCTGKYRTHNCVTDTDTVTSHYASINQQQTNTKKLSYRKDDRAMCHIWVP